MSITYHCDGFRPIRQGDLVDLSGGQGFETEVTSATDAARVFANRMAKRKYGKRGFCPHVNLNCRREDNTGFEFEAFIGVPWERTGCTGCTGRNIWLYVSVRRPK